MELFEQVGPSGQDPAVRSEELVRRADVEVGAGCGQVDRGVSGQMHPVHINQRACIVGPPA